MKIAFVSTTMTIGGAEKQVVDLAAEMHRNGHDITIVSCKGPTQQQIPDGVRLIELNGKKSLVGLVLLLVRLTRVLRAIRPDVVHGHMVIANLLTRLVRPFCHRAIFISTAHNTNEGGSRLRILAYRATDALADLTTNVSQQAVDRYIDLKAAPANKIIAVHNGIDFDRYQFDGSARMQLRRELGLTGNRIAYLAVGRLTPAKDYPNLLDAFATVVQTIVDSVLLVVGEGPEEHSVRSKANELGIASKVRFLGARTDIPALMSAADVFVLSSAWEGFGIVVVEALACELPAVATDSGGVRETLDGHGRLVPVADADALATAMIAAVQERHTRPGSKTQAARLHAQRRFSIDSVVRRWLELYASLARRSAS